MHPLIPTPAATARTRTQCSKFILIKVIPSSLSRDSVLSWPLLSFLTTSRNGPTAILEEARAWPFRPVRRELRMALLVWNRIAGPDIDAFGGRDRPGGLSYNFGA